MIDFPDPCPAVPANVLEKIKAWCKEVYRPVAIDPPARPGVAYQILRHLCEAYAGAVFNGHWHPDQQHVSATETTWLHPPPNEGALRQWRVAHQQLTGDLYTKVSAALSEFQSLTVDALGETSIAVCGKLRAWCEGGHHGFIVEAGKNLECPYRLHTPAELRAWQAAGVELLAGAEGVARAAERVWKPATVSTGAAVPVVAGGATPATMSGITAGTVGKRRGRLPKKDSQAARSTIVAFVDAHPTLKFDYVRLAEDAGVSVDTARRIVQEIESDRRANIQEKRAAVEKARRPD